MDAPALARKVIEHFEGSRLLPYDDATGKTIKSLAECRGKPTIGIGHAFRPEEWERFANGIAPEEQAALLAEDMAAAVRAVKPTGRGVAADAALIDFAFNAGAGALAQLLAHPDPQNQFELWVHAHVGGKVVVDEGLVKRRAVDSFLFFLGDLG